MSAIEWNIVSVKAALNCLAYALIIAMACVNGDPKYQFYRNGRGLKKPVEGLLKAFGWICITTEALRNFDNLKTTFRTKNYCV